MVDASCLGVWRFGGVNVFFYGIYIKKNMYFLFLLDVICALNYIFEKKSPYLQTKNILKTW
jgi:hypothetical protein